MDIRQLLKDVNDRIREWEKVRDGLQGVLNQGALTGVVQAAATRNGYTSGTKKKSAPKKKAKRTGIGQGGTRLTQPRGAAAEAVEHILRAEGGALSFSELYTRARARGWTSTSQDPKNVFGASLQYLVRRGKLRKVGGDYELPTTNPAPEIPITEPVVDTPASA